MFMCWTFLSSFLPFLASWLSFALHGAVLIFLTQTHQSTAVPTSGGLPSFKETRNRAWAGCVLGRFCGRAGAKTDRRIRRRKMEAGGHDYNNDDEGGLFRRPFHERTDVGCFEKGKRLG